MADVKICGISTIAALDAAIAGGASHVGFVHFAKSPRHLPIDAMAQLRRHVPAHVQAVTLLVNAPPDLVHAVISAVQPDALQFHGEETPLQLQSARANFAGELWKALPIRTRADLALSSQWNGAADRLLYDAKPVPGADLPGGNGLRFDWHLLEGFAHPLPWALAGGLDPANVARAIARTHAPLVDVSSGVESAPGIKDVDRIAAFLKAAKL